MKKVLVASAGGPASEGVIRSLLDSKEDFKVIGMGADPVDLLLSNTSTKYLVPKATENNYISALEKILETEKPDLIHAQNDREVLEISNLRELIHSYGTKTFLPKHSTVETCVDKWKTYNKFAKSGIKVPKNILISNIEDLKKSFSELANDDGKIWIRSNAISGGGMGALPTNNISFAQNWIDEFDGWGNFIAAEMLTPKTVTWLSIWFEGKLIVAQSRSRGGWVHGNRTLSGVTGVTKVGRTESNLVVDEIAITAIKSIDDEPHGIFGVDMAYDAVGIPNPTEINIARFFTTIYFFTKAGLNLPEIYANISLSNSFPNLSKKINPLKDGLLWLRGMDTEPYLIDEKDYDKNFVIL
jgi:carbamoyl-phosphate synthase large subunit